MDAKRKQHENKERKKEEEIHNQSKNNQKQLTHTQKTEQIIEKRK